MKRYILTFIFLTLTILIKSQVLQVDIISFYCTEKKLLWVTSNETELSHFEIETSENGKVWNYSSIVLAHGNSNTPIMYEASVDGTYVRLKYVSYAGTFYYYGIAYCKKYFFIESQEEDSFKLKKGLK